MQHFRSPHQAHPNACYTLCRDINVIGGRAFSEYLPANKRGTKKLYEDGDVDPNRPKNPNDPDYDPDEGFHGTHVAGIIGAKNDGHGPYGVLPGESCGLVKMAARALNGQRNCTTERSAPLQHLTPCFPAFDSTNRCQDLLRHLWHGQDSVLGPIQQDPGRTGVGIVIWVCRSAALPSGKLPDSPLWRGQHVHGLFAGGPGRVSCILYHSLQDGVSIHLGRDCKVWYGVRSSCR